MPGYWVPQRSLHSNGRDEGPADTPGSVVDGHLSRRRVTAEF